MSKSWKVIGFSATVNRTKNDLRVKDLDTLDSNYQNRKPDLTVNTQMDDPDPSDGHPPVPPLQ